MFGEIVFVNNRAAIFVLCFIVPVFLIFLFKCNRTEKRNEKLKKDAEDARGKAAVAEEVIQHGGEYEFKEVFTEYGSMFFVVVIKDLRKIKFCYIANTKKWRTGDTYGLKPEKGVIYRADIQDNVIHLNRKEGSRH
ncbi:MAG: hypothetical protein WC229_00330 [Candidatus Paceibacterota bacterium]|jgi:hypothetical protein